MQTLADRLKEARLAAGLSLSELQVKTKIRYRYLEAIERGAFFEIPGDVYARGFLRSYAREVGLDPEAVVDEYRRWCQQQPPSMWNRPGWRPLGGTVGNGRRRGEKVPVFSHLQQPKPSGSIRLVAVAVALLVVGMAAATASLWRSGSPAPFPNGERGSGAQVLPASEQGFLGWIGREASVAEEGESLSGEDPSGSVFLEVGRVERPASVHLTPDLRWR